MPLFEASLVLCGGRTPPRLPKEQHTNKHRTTSSPSLFQTPKDIHFLQPKSSQSAKKFEMLDIFDFIVEKGGDPEKIKESQRRRYAPPEAVDEVIELYEDHRKSGFSSQALQVNRI